jgi:hypothetical protein
MRALSDTFMFDLQDQNGRLIPLLTHVRMDDSLMLAIRNNYINIYYRGGNIVRISEQPSGSYSAFFDVKYNKNNLPLPILPNRIHHQADIIQWVQSFGSLKNVMDGFFTLHPKPEREFQQLIARENNNSSISNESEYFITDIEINQSTLRARFDMVGVRWRTNERKNGNKCRLALMEMKYADAALGGKAGLTKHLQDIDAFFSNRESHMLLCQTIESQFNQLDALGLLKYKHSKRTTSVQLNMDDKPEVIFILANHNPRSTKLSAFINDPAMDSYANSPLFDLRFFVASFAGYGLHADCMVPLEKFRELVSTYRNVA